MQRSPVHRGRALTSGSPVGDTLGPMAVYTEVSDEEVAAFAARYGLGEVLSCKGIAEGVENSNFLLVTEEGQFILTLYEKRVREEDLPFFIHVMEHLAAKGLSCPTPLTNDEGEALGRLAGRPAAIISFLPGLWPRKIHLEHCAPLGRALAEMHLAGSDLGMVRTNDLGMRDWRPLLESCDGRGDEVRPGLQAELDAGLDRLEAAWPTDLPTGLIHADLFPDNVFFRGESLSGIIDFYFACTDFLAYDLAICLNAWCFEGEKEFNVTKGAKLLAGYNAVRPLSDAEWDALPVLAEGSAMRFALTRLYDWINTPADAFVTRKDPLAYVRRRAFHATVKSAAEYGRLSP